jgi:hypothetical protein
VATSDPTAGSPTAVDALLAGIEAGVVPLDSFCPDAVLDATVPNWRFSVKGADAVRDELSGWFADPGHFEELRRVTIDEGEMLEFTLSWVENGIAHACHQLHVLHLRDGRVAADTAFCGGRWPAPLLARMEAARS